MATKQITYLVLLGYLLLTACMTGVVQREATVSDTHAEATDSATSPAPIQTPVAAPTLPPPTAVAAAPTPAATAEAGSESIIQYFRASVKKAASGDVIVIGSDAPCPQGKADPGDTIVFEWKTAGAISATLTISKPMPVDTTGTFTYQTTPEQYGCVPFSLMAAHTKDQIEMATIFIEFPCTNPLFFTSDQDSVCCGFYANYGCPEDAITSSAAEQHFEHGTMIWIKEWDRIYVLYEDVPVTSDQASASFDNEWDESQPDHDPSLVPPDGLYQPVRGFGLVWRQYPEVRERLGWAIDQETAFVTTVQRVPSAGKHWSLYIRALDGDIWRLFSTGFGQSWEKITED